MVRGDLLGRLAYTDRFKGDHGHELGNVGAALAHGWEALFKGGSPAMRIMMGSPQENKTTTGGDGLRELSINDQKNRYKLNSL